MHELLLKYRYELMRLNIILKIFRIINNKKIFFNTLKLYVAFKISTNDYSKALKTLKNFLISKTVLS